jgi:hypothetical protein
MIRATPTYVACGRIGLNPVIISCRGGAVGDGAAPVVTNSPKGRCQRTEADEDDRGRDELQNARRRAWVPAGDEPWHQPCDGTRDRDEVADPCDCCLHSSPHQFDCISGGLGSLTPRDPRMRRLTAVALAKRRRLARHRLPGQAETRAVANRRRTITRLGRDDDPDLDSPGPQHRWCSRGTGGRPAGSR